MARKQIPSAAPSEDLSISEALERAFAHWRAGQADQAEMFCQRVLAVWPRQADATYLLGLMAHAYGNLDLAIQHLKTACQAPRAPAVYFSDLAEMCRQRGLLEEAEHFGRRAVGLDAALVPGWNNLGIILQEAGKLQESLTCLENVVSLQPDYVEARNNLANTLQRLGRLDQAELHYAETLRRHPNYAEARSNLANLLTSRGQFDAAEAEARLAIELNPRLADAYINLAAITTARYRHADALRWLDALLAFAPLHSGGLAARAMTLKQLDLIDEALASARRAAEAASESAEAHNVLGQILQAAGQVDEALQYYERAAALPGLAAEGALANRAMLFMEIGRKAEAEAAFERALQAFPDSAQLRFNRSDFKTFQEGDPEFGRMEALLENSGARPRDDRISLHFALGKAYLDIKDSDRAFRHLNEGNRMKRAALQFDSEATSRWMGDIARRFTPALFETFKESGNVSRAPIFVVGIPRSGTSLIEQILSSHPAIFGAGELSALQRLADALGDYPASVERLTGGDLDRMGAAYIEHVQGLGLGKPQIVDKMPANFLHLGLIRLALPGAKIIHCRRDPVDTCLSCYSKLFSAEQLFAYDLAELGRFHRDYQKLMAHWRDVLPASSFMEVDYESVVDNLEGEARRLIDFLDLPWDDACARYYETARPVRTASVNQVRQPIYKTSKGRWRDHARNLGPLLDALGLDPA